MEFACPDGVYPPAEDSFLLAQSLGMHRGCIAIDVGCGSGIQALGLLFGGAAKVICLDISKQAIDAAKKNCTAAGFGDKIEARQSDLFANCPETADIIVFNPPYIETAEGKKKNGGLDSEDGKKFLDLDGGKMGREALDRFLGQMPPHLNAGGACYFLQTELNGYAATGRLLEKTGFEFEIVGRKKIFFEELAACRCRKN